MNIRLADWQDRINALQLRERLMLLALAVVSVFALAEVLWLAPAHKRLEQAQKTLATQQNALELLQAQAALQATDGQAAANSPRGQLASVNAQIDGVTQEIRAITPNQRDATTLRGVLETFLQRQEGLSLVRTSTLSADALPLFAHAAGTSTPVVVAHDRRGLELTVAGPYPELMRYVQSLEQALPNLRWGALVLSNQESTGTQLTLQVFMVEGTP
jgi:MSHA biogenesis protein MshJ